MSIVADFHRDSWSQYDHIPTRTLNENHKPYTTEQLHQIADQYIPGSAERKAAASVANSVVNPNSADYIKSADVAQEAKAQAGGLLNAIKDHKLLTAAVVVLLGAGAVLGKQAYDNSKEQKLDKIA